VPVVVLAGGPSAGLRPPARLPDRLLISLGLGLIIRLA